MRDLKSAVFIDNGSSNMDRPYSKSRLWLRNPMKNGGAPLPIHLFTDQLQELMAGTMILAERPEHHG